MKFTRYILLCLMLLLGKSLILRTHIFGIGSPLPVLLFETLPLIFLLGIGALCCQQRFRRYFNILNIILSTYFFSAEFYYDYFGRLLDLHAITQAPMLLNIKSSIIDLFSIGYLVYYLDIFLRLAFKQLKLFRSYNINFGPQIKNRNLLVATSTCFFLLLGCIFVAPAKQNVIAFAKNYGIINAQLYDFFINIYQTKISTFNNETTEDMSGLNALKQTNTVKWPKYFGAAAGYNIITVQLESTENFVIGLALDGQEVTPNLNRLSKESLYFPYFYSQIGQGNTSDAEFVVNTSIYPRAKGAVSTDFIGLSYPSLPRLLKTQGYTSLTFHPNTITFWSRDNLYPCLGFDKVFEKKFYGDDDLLGPWGSSDEMLFKKALPILKEYQTNKQNFYASFITLTNHHPYQIPDSRKKIKLPEQLQNTFLGNYLASVNYEDYALGLFIKELKLCGLWDKSILVIFGDHFGISKSLEKENQKFFFNILGREHDSIDSLNVPLIIKVPCLKGQIVNTVGGQIDILPTLANLMGLRLDGHVFFGQDILNYNTNLLGFRFYYPEGTYISADLFHLAGSSEAISIRNRKKSANKELISQDEQRILELMKLSDSYINTLAKQSQLKKVPN